MTPVKFPQANVTFGPPEDLEESQCKSIPAYVGEVKAGSVDGASMVVVAWKPSEAEMAELNAGGYVYLQCLGGLPPHYVATSFEHAINVA